MSLYGLFLQITYCVVCPDIDPLTSAASDFFQQLGTGEWSGLRLNSTMWTVFYFHVLMCETSCPSSIRLCDVLKAINVSGLPHEPYSSKNSSMPLWSSNRMLPDLYASWLLIKDSSHSVSSPHFAHWIVLSILLLRLPFSVYEICKLGTHSPQGLGNQMEMESGKLSSSGFILLDSPQSMKIESSNASLVGSISDYFLSLSNGWDLTSYLKYLSKALRALKLGPYFSTNPNEGNNSSCMVSGWFFGLDLVIKCS